ncbi:hypothetical protein M501DRAFT_1030899 [Patellaria atrata CBS 101060]|uniref:Uncharacterized protein n=1 Tax=Patellaria atrata CBS 101060 TaxID=1346257 RepID=A0A9P4SC06_9PEZI|nr:hypothetical protein M501DRAFT_1030899 [Patellaria atrata CBS 101060]
MNEPRSSRKRRSSGIPSAIATLIVFLGCLLSPTKLAFRQPNLDHRMERNESFNAPSAKRSPNCYSPERLLERSFACVPRTFVFQSLAEDAIDKLCDIIGTKSCANNNLPHISVLVNGVIAEISFESCALFHDLEDLNYGSCRALFAAFEGGQWAFGCGHGLEHGQYGSGEVTFRCDDTRYSLYLKQSASEEESILSMVDALVSSITAVPEVKVEAMLEEIPFQSRAIVKRAFDALDTAWMTTDEVKFALQSSIRRYAAEARAKEVAGGHHGGDGVGGDLHCTC